MQLEKITGIPIIVTTKVFQNRKHKRPRINKKWRKRYGCTVVEVQEHPFIFDGILYCRESDFEAIKSFAKKITKERKRNEYMQKLRRGD